MNMCVGSYCLGSISDNNIMIKVPFKVPTQVKIALVVNGVTVESTVKIKLQMNGITVQLDRAKVVGKVNMKVYLVSNFSLGKVYLVLNVKCVVEKLLLVE